ncbi:hypothetical protein D9V86_02610 [Bacteroidetes/Chlorobi group bacterium ChocPot_Mid]|nr:MAG: hypothetical protein D9V86_02610 [Bacteroidetes/Chlorobi group bacterium ChocPot_Mid]
MEVKFLRFVMIKSVYVLAIINIFFTYQLFSSNNEENFLLGTKYGFSVLYTNNFQAVDMRQLPSVWDSIPRTASGSSNGFNVGAFYEYRMTDRTSFLLRGFLNYNIAQIEGTVPEEVISNGLPAEFNVLHKIKSDLSSIKFEPLIRYRLFKEFSLFGGFNAGLRFSQMFEHKKTLLGEQGIFFKDGSQIITGLDKNIEGKLGIQASLVVGFGYDIPVNFNGQYLICPEIMMETGYSDIASRLTWDMNSVRFGISLKYSENPTIKYEIKEIRRNRDSVRIVNIERADIKKEFLEKGRTFITSDTILTEKYRIITNTLNRVDTLFYPTKSVIKDISISERLDNGKVDLSCLKVYAMASDGSIEYPKKELYIEEYHSTNIKPLLNYVFFDESSSKLSSRYNLLNEFKARRFRLEDLSNLSTLDTYYHLLNIIGKRLQVFANATIKVTGYNAGIGEEKENLELSKKRANVIKDYFVNIWKIEPERIMVEWKNLPERASNMNDADGVEENRRVEINSDYWDILSPVIINDTLREVTPSQVRFYNNGGTCYNIDKWSLEVNQSGNSLIIFKGENKMPERLIWRLYEVNQTLPRNESPVTFKVQINDYYGNKIVSKEDTIKITIKTLQEKENGAADDKKIDKYSLILFDFDKSELNKENQKILDFINEKIKKSSKVLIEGFTDRMGDDTYNKNLSKRRAETVASKIKNTKNIIVEGKGENELMYNNELPEGRFYSRTVNITVETEIEK